MSQQKTLLSFFTKKSVPNTTPPEANNNLINKTDKVKAGLDQKSNANSCNSENGTGTATGTARQNGSLDVSNISHHDDDAVDTDSAKGKVYDEGRLDLASDSRLRDRGSGDATLKLVLLRLLVTLKT